MTSRFLRNVASVLILSLVTAPGWAQTKKEGRVRKAKPGVKAKAKAGKGGGGLAPGGSITPIASAGDSKAHQDFPALSIAPNGLPLVAYVEWDGKADTVRFAKLTDKGLIAREALSEAGNIQQPCLARDGNGVTWCIWSQLRDGRWDLCARTIDGGQVGGKVVSLAGSPGTHVFADAKTDRKGRVWVTWQRFAGGFCDVFAKVYDPKAKSWSDSMQVTRHPAGDWEPRLAFGAGDDALIVFDSYRSGNYDVWLARVTPAGKVKLSVVAATDRYEARAEAAGSADGKGLWVAYEDGVKRWGKDMGSEWRVRGGGLNYDRRIKFVYVDLATGKVSKVADLTALIPGLVATVGVPGSPGANVPEVVVDKQGDPHVLFRYAKGGFWRIATARYDVASKAWTEARTLLKSNHVQDRRCAVAVNDDGKIFVACPDDGRTGVKGGDTNVYVARLDGAKVAMKGPLPFDLAGESVKPPFQPVNNTAERPRDDHHTWTVKGEKYTLYWGDLHRHTDFSKCRTTDDGCIVEHYRYAYDAAGMDYLATSDHSDAAKAYPPYEWWQTQKLADIFHNPPFFLGFYAYEREQGWPYGHRNVVFLKRGGPIIYIKRTNYENSIWSKIVPLPPQAGQKKGDISPEQLWAMLRKFGQRVITIEHTPAGGMGTDWSVYKDIDSKIENLVEIYQGSRNSFEGVGAPQPAVATNSKSQFGKFSAGVYQNALKQGWKLGAFASSDHRSTHISFGGIYAKEFSRKGLFDAMDQRHTVAATDKIFMQFACNGHMMGEVFDSSTKPKMEIMVRGTAPLRAVTIIRNEVNVRRIDPKGKADLDATFTDEEPVRGENRYYVRVEQTDGNMGWTSPVWVTYKP